MTTNAESVIAHLSRYSSVELAFLSQDVEDALANDLKEFASTSPSDSEGGDALDSARQADDLFNRLRIPVHFSQDPVTQIKMWERVLTVLSRADRQRYDVLHKGTPYYFLGIASFLAEDFERAVFYLDCAVQQDHRLHGQRWYRIPSGMFLRLDDLPLEQAGRSLVRQGRVALEQYADAVANEGGEALSLQDYRARLVNQSIEGDPQLRSVVTALLSFLLEIAPRRRQLDLAPPDTGTGEPFFLHLFKGGVLFESILRSSSDGAGILASKPKASLKDFLESSIVYQGLGFSSPPQGYGARTFSDLLRKVMSDSGSGDSFSHRAVRTVWGLRNATGHNLAWHSRPSLQEYDKLVVLVLGSIMLAVKKLYSERYLENGSA